MTDTHNRKRSSEEVEREVESARDDLRRSIEKLEAEFTPDALVERGMAYFRGDGRRHLETLGTRAQANPLSVLLIGIGVAWLAFGPSRTPEMERRARYDDDDDRPDFRGDRTSDPYAAPPPPRPASDLSTGAPTDRTGMTTPADTMSTRPDLSAGRSTTSGMARETDPVRPSEPPLTKDESRPTPPGSVSEGKVATGTGIGSSPLREPVATPTGVGTATGGGAATGGGTTTGSGAATPGGTVTGGGTTKTGGAATGTGTTTGSEAATTGGTATGSGTTKSGGTTTGTGIGGNKTR